MEIDLRERLTVAVAERGIVKVNENHVETLDDRDYRALLSALGLSDFDAAVERAAISLHKSMGPGPAWEDVATPDYKTAIRTKAREMVTEALRVE